MRDFTQGSISKHLISFSLPIIIGDFLISIYYVIDAIWVGRLLGPRALASVSVSIPLIFFLVSLLIGFRVATNILVGQSYGGGDEQLLSKVLANSLMISILLCAFISGVSIFLSRSILEIINTPSNLKLEAHIYFVIIMAGLIFRFMYNWFSGVLKGLGDSKTPLVLLIISVILNIILTPILIIGAGPIPNLGIAGAALGTVISVFAVTVAGFIYLTTHTEIFDVKRWQFKLDFFLIKRIFIIGIPVSLKMLVKSFSWIVIISLVNKFGPDVIAAYGIGIRLDMFAFLPALSIGIATSSMVAQNIGATQYQRVPEILKSSIILSLCFSVIFFILVNIYPRSISSIFTNDAVVINYAQNYFRIVSLSYILFSFIFTFEGIIRGAGQTMYILIFTVISIIFIRLPLAYVLSQFTPLQESGIWLAIVVSAFTAAVLNSLYYLSRRWKVRVESK
jgi:putative MATE family efflux protein